eukprot:3411419-Pleurochrysis_carterae.AAC.1
MVMIMISASILHLDMITTIQAPGRDCTQWEHGVRAENGGGSAKRNRARSHLPILTAMQNGIDGSDDVGDVHEVATDSRRGWSAHAKEVHRRYIGGT